MIRHLLFGCVCVAVMDFTGLVCCGQLPARPAHGALWAVNVAQSQQTSTQRPVFMNYWDLSRGIVSEEWARVDLEISPSQLDQIIAMRRDGELLAEFDKRRNPRVNPAEVWHELDSVVRSRLAKILLPAQLDGIDVRFLRHRYFSGTQPFLDREIQLFAGISAADIGRIRDDITKAQNRLNSDVSRLERFAASTVLDELPQHSKELFAQYAGNELCANIVVRKESFNEELYPNTLRNSIMGGFVSKDPSVCKGVTLTEAQIASLNAIRKDASAKVNFGYSPDTCGPFPEYFAKICQEEWETSKSVLSTDQLATAMRTRATAEFLANCYRPFSNKKFVTYLAMDEKTTSTVLRVANEQALILEVQRRKLNGEIFREIAAKLPPKSADQLTSLFTNVWDE